MSNHFPIWILLSAIACCAGCRLHSAPAAFWPLAPYGQCDGPPGDNLAVRTAYMPPDSPVISPDEVNATTPRRITPDYLALTPQECQCQAATASTTAKLIDVEYRLTSCAAMQENSHDECVIHKTRTQLDILAMRAARERNQAAGEAMKFYYQLASAHAAQDAIAESLRLADRSISDLRSLRAGHTPVNSSEEELLAKRAKLLAKQSELDKSIAQLSGLVVTLTGRGLHAHPPVWPVVPMDLSYEPVDVEAAVAMGLQQRRDLAITRCMLRSLNSNSLPDARAVLKGADFGVGNPVSPAMSGLCRNKQDYSLEISMRRCQLQIVLADQTRAAAEEIRAAALVYEAAMRDAVLHSQRYSLLKQRLQDLRQLRQAGKANPLEVTQAELEVAESRGEFTVKIIDAHSGEARLRQAMEYMADECGNAPKLLGACSQCSPCADKTETRRGLLRQAAPGDVSQNELRGTQTQTAGAQPPRSIQPVHTATAGANGLEEQVVETFAQPVQPSLANYVPHAPARNAAPSRSQRVNPPLHAIPFAKPPVEVAVQSPAAITPVQAATPAAHTAVAPQSGTPGFTHAAEAASYFVESLRSTIELTAGKPASLYGDTPGETLGDTPGAHAAQPAPAISHTAVPYSAKYDYRLNQRKAIPRLTR